MLCAYPRGVVPWDVYAFLGGLSLSSSISLEFLLPDLVRDTFGIFVFFCCTVVVAAAIGAAAIGVAAIGAAIVVPQLLT